MANYALTASAVDSLVGANALADSFLIGAAGRLVGTDTVRGGSGAVIDTLLVQAAMTLTAASFANVSQIERVNITAAAGASVTLANAMVESSDAAVFQAFGGAGNDTISGAGIVSRGLNLQGGGGNDSLLGGGGNDLLAFGAGNDTVFGGAGNDTFTSTLAELGAGDVLDGGEGVLDVLRLTTAGGMLSGVTLRGIERIELAAALTTALTFRLSAEAAASAAAPLTVAGAGGADWLVASAVASGVVLRGEGGADWLVGGTAADLLLGGADNDTMNGFHGDDTLDGGEGNDRLIGGTGHDLLLGGAGDDRLLGGGGNDTLDAGTGTDVLGGGAGNDHYRFIAGELTSLDLIVDEDGAADVLELMGPTPINLSGALLSRVQGIERFLLGAGNDTVVASNALGDGAGADVVTIEGGAGDDRIDVSQVARLTTPLAFLLRGDDGADTLVGGRGADTLDAGAGIGLMSGGLGNDLLIVRSAEFGAGTMDGGTGTDVLRLVGDETLGPDTFAGVSNIEVIELSASGQDIALPAALSAALGFTALTIRDSQDDDRVDVSAFASGQRTTIELGDGNDILLGGAGNETVFVGGGVDNISVGAGTNRVTFGPGDLSALDTVTASTATATDTIVVGVGAGQTLAQGIFAGVSGFDVFNLDGGAGSAARLPATLVSQSGQASVSVNVSGEGMVVDGRALASGIRLNGSNGIDVLFGGSGADTLVGNGGDDTLVGGDGGDRIFLGGTADENVALIRSPFDGTADINITQPLTDADSVDGTQFADNFIMVDSIALGLPGATTFFIGNGQNISLNFSAAVLPTEYEIAGDAFGTLTAVRNAVGARLTDNDPAVFEKIILVIGGASNTRFGVYFFEDRDNNATVDSTDLLRLLAIGTGDVPFFNEGRGFRLTDDFDLV